LYIKEIRFDFLPFADNREIICPAERGKSVDYNASPRVIAIIIDGPESIDKGPDLIRTVTVPVTGNG